MIRVADDDPTARQDLAVRVRPRVQRIARALLRHDADADDATQASILEILRAAASFRGESSLAAWADRIAVRTIMRVARQRRLWSLRVDGVEPDLLTSPARESGPELPRHIACYLDRLPETRRTALVLKYAMGYSVAEIAGLTGVSENTVKDRLLEARREMRRLIGRDGSPFERERKLEPTEEP